jgi:hypothetical protein
LTIILQPFRKQFQAKIGDPMPLGQNAKNARRVCRPLYLCRGRRGIGNRRYGPALEIGVENRKIEVGFPRRAIGSPQMCDDAAAFIAVTDEFGLPLDRIPVGC